MNPQVLIVDDDDTGRILQSLLRQHEMDATWVRDGHQALDLLRNEPSDLVVLDIDLGASTSTGEAAIDGLHVLRQMRANLDGAIPVLMLSRIGVESVKVVAFELGADDFVTKPFGPRELVARANRLLRRQPVRGGTRRPPRGLCIDVSARRVTAGETTIPLTPTEFDLFLTLARHAGQVLSRAQILEHIREGAWVGDTRVVDTHVRNLRRKLRELGPDRPRITTVRQVGYRLDGHIPLG